MDRDKRIRLIMLLAGLVLYAWAVFFCNLAGKDANMVHLVLEQSVDAAAAEGIFTQEGEVGFCFWGEADRQTVSCRGTGTSAQVTQVFLSGNPELMGAGCLEWQAGCLIDEETARTLFGTALCGGQTLLHNGTVYRVLGTVSALRPTILTMAEEGASLNRCVLALPAENGKTLGEAFLMRWGLRGTVLDFYPFLALMENLLLLFPGILLLTVSGPLGKDWRKLSLSGIFRQPRILGKTALVLGILWLLAKRLVLPPDTIPSRWSDFSFWGTWWAAQKENFLRILFVPLGSRQLQMLLNMVKSIGNSTAAALIALWAIRRREHADIADRG